MNHGTRYGFRSGCRCDACRESEREYQRGYYLVLREVTGGGGLVPASPVLAHLDALIANGMTSRRIARVCGVNESTIRGICRRPTGTVHKRVADRILTVRPGVTAVGLTRRVRALAALGWSTRVVAEVAKLNLDTVTALRRGETANPKAVAVAGILRAYAELSMRTPARGRSSTPVRHEAERQGWAPPLAWDDDSIDNPDAKPQGAGYEPPTVIEQIRELEEQGLSRDQIARVRGVSRDAIHQAISRAQRQERAA